MYINNYFPTTIWSESKPEFVKSLTKLVTHILKKQEKLKKLNNGLKNMATLGDRGIQHN